MSVIHTHHGPAVHVASQHDEEGNLREVILMLLTNEKKE